MAEGVSVPVYNMAKKAYKIPGLDELIFKLDKLDPIAAEEARRAMESVVPTVRRRAAQNAPRRTGRLAGSIYGKVSGTTLANITGAIGSSIFPYEVYPFLMEVGRKPNPKTGRGRIRGRFYLYYAPRDEKAAIQAAGQAASDRITERLAEKTYGAQA